MAPGDGTGKVWDFVEKSCAQGTVFNPEVHFCDFPDNVLGCEDVEKEGR